MIPFRSAPSSDCCIATGVPPSAEFDSASRTRHVTGQTIDRVKSGSNLSDTANRRARLSTCRRRLRSIEQASRQDGAFRAAPWMIAPGSGIYALTSSPAAAAASP